MLYLFTCTDTEKARAEFLKTRAALVAKYPDATVKELGDDGFAISSAEELLAARGLFEKTLIVSFRTLSKDERGAEFLQKNAKALAASENIFLVYEEDARKTFLAPIEKHAEKVLRFDAPPAKKEFPRAFALAEALLLRDKKSAWVTLQELLTDDIPSEQIFGALFWQIKMAALVKKAGSNGSPLPGIAPFVAGKALRLGKKYSERELLALLGKCVDLYHSREDGVLPPELALEKLVLSH